MVSFWTGTTTTTLILPSSEETGPYSVSRLQVQCGITNDVVVRLNGDYSRLYVNYLVESHLCGGNIDIHDQALFAKLE